MPDLFDDDDAYGATLAMEQTETDTGYKVNTEPIAQDARDHTRDDDQEADQTATREQIAKNTIDPQR